MAYTGILLEHEGKFLLQLRENKPEIKCPGMWGLFGGGIEDGETPEQGIIREIKEELGINLIEEDIKLIKKVVYYKEDYYIFRTKLEEKPENLTLYEGEDMQLFSTDEVIKLSNVASGLKELLLNLKNYR